MVGICTLYLEDYIIFVTRRPLLDVCVSWIPEIVLCNNLIFMCTTGHARNPIEKWTRTAVYSGVTDETIKNYHESSNFFYSLEKWPVFPSLILTLSFPETWPAFLDLACLRLILDMSLLDTWPVSAWHLACLPSFIFGLSLLQKLPSNLWYFSCPPGHWPVILWNLACPSLILLACPSYVAWPCPCWILGLCLLDTCPAFLDTWPVFAWNMASLFLLDFCLSFLVKLPFTLWHFSCPPC
jgi:hypothetical protein